MTMNYLTTTIIGHAMIVRLKCYTFYVMKITSFTAGAPEVGRQGGLGCNCLLLIMMKGKTCILAPIRIQEKSTFY